MQIFVVADAFEKPIATIVPAPLQSLRASECGECHGAIHTEWLTTIHRRAWTDPYFQTDWRFEGSPQICKNCHIPLDRQQEHLVLGFRDRHRLDPILAPNPDFDPALQQEGVTCAACHLREGKILGTRGDTDAPHPVRKIANGNEICLRCHVVGGNRWDTFYRYPPCGTVAEIEQTHAGRPRRWSGEAVVQDVAALGCVECHMPAVERPVAGDGPVRTTRRHLWRGGHDPETVRGALAVSLREEPARSTSRRLFRLTLENTGASHFLPTGTPDRHLTVVLRALDEEGRVVREQRARVKRTVMWRPFIIDLWDTRLPRHVPRDFTFEPPAQAAALEAVVSYHLLAESRARRIGYEPVEPIAYEVFRERRALR